MKFIDEAVIEVQAGKGGPGSRHFRREKFVPLGGPDGGNGGRGGSVILKADQNVHTLLDFKFQAVWKATDGAGGAGAGKDGRAGEDVTILLPVGTQIYRVDQNEEPTDLVVDLDVAGREFVLAKGGRGGKGNLFFKTSTNQAPEHAQPGEAGEAGFFLLSLKLVADVGLVGFPNAGKSTLISRISAARPKIADYPFTTLVPNLGVVQGPSSKRSFVVADIPGLIPGASEGRGLGIQFLKHVERTKVIAHLLDLTHLNDDGEESDLVKDFDSINHELRMFSEELAERPQIVVLTKVDSVSSPERVELYRTEFEKRGYKVAVISSVVGTGVPQLIEDLADIALIPQEEAAPQSEE